MTERTVTMKDTVTIDGTEYVRADIAGAPTPAPWQIVVLQRGWVVVGRVHRDGDELTITDSSVIRRWGTTQGIGELANGPLADTVLDPAGVVRAHVLTVVMSIDAPGWSA
jgi:hypothetical protein